MKDKKNTRQRSEQIRQVSAGVRDVLGMTQSRKEHPKATWAEIEAAVDERINQLQAQLIQDMVQIGGARSGARCRRRNVPNVRRVASPSPRTESKRASSKRREGKQST